MTLRLDRKQAHFSFVANRKQVGKTGILQNKKNQANEEGNKGKGGVWRTGVHLTESTLVLLRDVSCQCVLLLTTVSLRVQTWRNLSYSAFIIKVPKAEFLCPVGFPLVALVWTVAMLLMPSLETWGGKNPISTSKCFVRPSWMENPAFKENWILVGVTVKGCFYYVFPRHHYLKQWWELLRMLLAGKLQKTKMERN